MKHCKLTSFALIDQMFETEVAAFCRGYWHFNGRIYDCDRDAWMMYKLKFPN